MKKVYLLSLGCPKNLVDNEILSTLLQEKEFEIVNDPTESEIILISTCAFIRLAVEETIESILELAHLKQPYQKLVVIGCLVERYKDQLPLLLPEVDAWIGIKSLPYLPDWLEKNSLPKLSLEGPGWQKADYFKRIPSNPFTAYVKIAEGCSNHCTFCTIPKIRGPLKSRPIEEIVTEVEQLVKQGIKEIVLVAHETSAYGLDLYGKASLTSLLKTLDKTGVTWLRILYVHPQRAFSLIEAFNACSHLTPYLDIPIQHIDTEVLKSMGRGMKEKDLREIILFLKKHLPNVKLRTTVMVGFPTETEEAFKKLLSFLEEVAFDHLGVFKYSAEEGTAAFKLGDKVPEEVKDERFEIVMNLQQEIARKKHQNYVGTKETVFIDRLEEGYVAVGRTPWQAPEIDGEVYITKGEALLGEIKKVKIIDAYDYDLIGIITGPSNNF